MPLSSLGDEHITIKMLCPAFSAKKAAQDAASTMRCLELSPLATSSCFFWLTKGKVLTGLFL